MREFEVGWRGLRSFHSRSGGGCLGSGWHDVCDKPKAMRHHRVDHQWSKVAAVVAWPLFCVFCMFSRAFVAFVQDVRCGSLQHRDSDGWWLARRSWHKRRRITFTFTLKRDYDHYVYVYYAKYGALPRPYLPACAVGRHGAAIVAADAAAVCLCSCRAAPGGPPPSFSFLWKTESPHRWIGERALCFA